MAKIICIDPGHGGVQPGAVNGSRKEKDDVLKMALAVQKLLVKQGIKVVMTRTTDKDVEIMDRCAIANNADADYFISIHRNSGGGTGHEAWVLSSATSATTAKAKTIVDNICKVDGKNRGVKKGAVSYSDFGVNKYSNMPSCLLELGFIDSSADNTSFDKHFDAFALAIAKGLCAAVGVTYKSESADTGKTESKPAAKPEKEEETFMAKTYKNGSTTEKVYQTTADCKAGKNSIGSLNKWETCECVGIYDGCYAVVYTVDGTSSKKTGFVKYSGGVK